MSGKKDAKGAKVAKGAKKGAKKEEEKPKVKSFKKEHAHLFEKRPKDFGIGRSAPLGQDFTRFVKWPVYVRLQRQKAILKQRLKVPPAVNQFTNTLDKNQASTLFRLLAHYVPESPEEKRKRLKDQAAKEVKGDHADDAQKPRVLKFGLNHVTQLVESRKAKLVVIAHDVDPIELVVWLPALCRKKDIPYVIVKNKSRLGRLVHQKNATAVALVDIKKEHLHQLEQFVGNVRPLYNDQAYAERKKWGGGILGAKTIARLRARDKARAAPKAQ